ncbi:MAG: hypothetical protein ACD_78C00086G0002 [uncultured bacterium (gcode 4)]|uniref:Uncharacterized protein n=1 Tax=uncultured bacterium (gcode 4) TaxID=1234023 RepID=K1YY45_9BACT|nr:MAG: hypothetical protein ACD_78C00086G0002 [uncultured bacterium (gcode 4)]HBB26915.1 hypothetical protein [Candidatus Gracilibacteria bacterium]
MLSSEINKRPGSSNDQLSLDFTNNSPVSTKTRIADSVYDITSGKITFHPEKSEIGENSFALKISYMGRSYSLKGVYKKEEIRSFHQKDFSETTVRIIRFDSILAFRDGRYISALLPPKNFNEITKNIQGILSDYCRNIMIH